MKIKGVRALMIIALLLEILNLLALIFLTIYQKTAKLLVMTDPEVMEIVSLPIGSAIKVIPVLIICIVAVALFMGKVDGTRIKSVLLVVLMCVIKGVASGNRFLNNFIATQGIDNYASYVALEGVAGLIISPLQMLSFCLFCVACGAYYGMEERSE